MGPEQALSAVRVSARRGPRLIDASRTAPSAGPAPDPSAQPPPPPLVCTADAEALCPGAVPDGFARAAFGGAGDGGAGAVAAVVAITDLSALDSEAARERKELAVKLRMEEARLPDPRTPPPADGSRTAPRVPQLSRWLCDAVAGASPPSAPRAGGARPEAGGDPEHQAGDPRRVGERARAGPRRPAAQDRPWPPRRAALPRHRPHLHGARAPRPAPALALRGGLLALAACPHFRLCKLRD